VLEEENHATARARPLTTDATSSWDIHGDPALLVEAARTLRRGVEMSAYRSRPPGEYAMLSLARLLDAIAFSIHIDGVVHHNGASGATEAEHHVLRYLLPAVPSEIDSDGPR
jgi:hypothetical protein